jgi:hypothetical protein
MNRDITVQDVRRMDAENQEAFRKARQRLESRKVYERSFRAIEPRAPTVRIEVPPDVRRVTSTAPCFNCNTRAGVPCRHRPWEGDQ